MLVKRLPRGSGEGNAPCETPAPRAPDINMEQYAGMSQHQELLTWVRRS